MKDWKTAAQGEIKISRLSQAPDLSTMAKLEPEDGHLIVGHSETGHHHVLDREKASVFVAGTAPEGMRVLYAIVKEPTPLTHLRPHDTHAPIDLAPGAYELRIGREFDPYADLARRVAD